MSTDTKTTQENKMQDETVMIKGILRDITAFHQLLIQTDDEELVQKLEAFEGTLPYFTNDGGIFMKIKLPNWEKPRISGYYSKLIGKKVVAKVNLTPYAFVNDDENEFKGVSLKLVSLGVTKKIIH